MRAVLFLVDSLGPCTPHHYPTGREKTAVRRLTSRLDETALAWRTASLRRLGFDDLPAQAQIFFLDVEPGFNFFSFLSIQPPVPPAHHEFETTNVM